MNENIVEIDEPIRNALIRPWSLIRCIISPKSFVSKKCSGNLINFIRKSEIRVIEIRALTWSNIQLRINSTES